MPASPRSDAHTHAAILTRGSAHLQLQDQVHPVLAEGADVIKDEGCDDVDPIGFVGHDAALGEQRNVLSHGCCRSSQLHPPTQPRSRTVPCLQHQLCLITLGAPTPLPPWEGHHLHHYII